VPQNKALNLTSGAGKDGRRSQVNAGCSTVSERVLLVGKMPIALLAVIVLLGASPRPPQTERTAVTIDGMVLCGMCGGSWSVSISPRGRLHVRVSGEREITKQLTSVELSQLRGVVGTLPKGQKQYAFGEHYIDASTMYELEVRGPAGTRVYSLTSDLRPDEKDRLEVRAINGVWHHIRNLFESEKALELLSLPRQ
jgi:hypothetical protein